MARPFRWKTPVPGAHRPSLLFQAGLRLLPVDWDELPQFGGAKLGILVCLKYDV